MQYTESQTRLLSAVRQAVVDEFAVPVNDEVGRLRARLNVSELTVQALSAETGLNSHDTNFARIEGTLEAATGKVRRFCEIAELIDSTQISQIGQIGRISDLVGEVASMLNSQQENR